MASSSNISVFQNIVQQISLTLRPINLGFDEKLVGMETRVRDVISYLEPGTDEVRMIGIWGMGGAGKTTLAKAVFDQISFQFEGKSFVENVREESKPSLSGLKSLQKQVLSDILNDQGIAVSGVLDGKNKMRKAMGGRKVLLVLDDVNHKDQLEALAGNCYWFKPGSRIIITTRDKQVLAAHGVGLISNATLLSEAEAGCLFSRHAFGRENPVQRYEELSGQVVQYAHGLPLMIKVLGSFLCGKNELEWEDAIDRLKTIPLKDTLKRLELSYVTLEDEYKEIFLDIACILKGQQKEDAIRILESCGFHARIGLEVLEQRSLITVDEYGRLDMHDHIEEMGKNIVRRGHPDEPQKHSRLWVKEEIEYILANDLGTQATRCLKLNKSRVNARIIMKGLGKMKKLRYLKVTNADYDKGTTRDELLLIENRVNVISDSEARFFDENVSKASMFGLKKLQEQVLSNKRLRFSLGIMLMLIMVCVSYFYSMASCSNSSATKLMVSTSNSSVENSFKYDVFLSFRGVDTRTKFVGHLYEALKHKGIETYKDDEAIEQGERINYQLLKAIEESRFYIVVFSKNYASSSWCLDELVKIMECQKMTEHTAFPVFYDVEPTKVRKQDGPVGEAFSKHKNHEAAGKWRDAMKELAGLAGWDLANRDESELIQMIVDTILEEIYSTLSDADGKLVGMETRIRKVLSSLEIGTEDVRMIGIRGIGGGGKTTLARAVYNQISNHFEGKSFIENIREVSQPSLSGLKEPQKRILEDVLNKKDITFSSVHDGKNMLKATMRRRKILVVLDDVDRIEQLEALAGSSDWFKSGSRIIITTRDEQVLLAHGVSMNFVHDVNLLSHEEAICLFSRYAFQKEIPTQGYEELSRQVVQYADGLPLTIKVLGSFLCRKDKLEWQDAIDRLKKIPLKETLEKLELSYISLEDDYKEIFLDIACILKGQHKQKAIRILESYGFHAINGLKVLEQRSFITISKCGVLGMHDHIEEMGKNIVRRGHPDEPHKHSRLWIKEEIEEILANDMGTDETRCIKLDMSRENSRILMKGLGKMKKLRYLEVNFAYYDTESDASQLDESTQYFPNSLKYLKCERYPFLNLPSTFQANNLVELEMKCSRMVQLWEEGEKKDLQKLKFLSLSNSELTTFDFRITPNLEELYLENSDELEELCVPGCQKLKHLDVSDSITFDHGLTPNLKTLSLFVCTHFLKLKVPVECPNLKYLNLRKSRLRSKSLDLQYSDELVETNTPVGCLKRLKGLYVTSCCRLGKLPKEIGQVELLEKLDLCSFEKLKIQA